VEILFCKIYAIPRIGVTRSLLTVQQIYPACKTLSNVLSPHSTNISKN